MIKNLSLMAKFKNPAFTLATRFQPQTGITAVVGPNESGKTTSTIELTRYLLFGHKARRGDAKGYQQYDASGEFVIGDETYHINRNAKREEITDAAGTILAVGASEVTAKVEEKLGYGLEVFDICNASVQKKGTKFGDMRPAERKRLIDRVVGLTSNEKVEKACRDEAKMLKREVEALTRQLVAPVKPEGTPANVAELDLMLRDAQRVRKQADELLRGIVILDLPNAPSPWGPPSDEQIAQMRSHELERAQIIKDVAALERIIEAGQELVAYSREELADAAEKNRLGPVPTMTQDELEPLIKAWEVFNSYVPSEEVVCPQCDNHFHPTGTPPEMPSVPRDVVSAQIHAHIQWKDVPLRVGLAPDLSAQEIKDELARWDAKDRARDAKKTLEATTLPEDLSASLRASERLVSEWEVFNRLKEQVAKQEIENASRTEALSKLGAIPSDEDIDALWQQLNDAKTYRDAMERYAEDNARFSALSAEIKDKEELAEEFGKGASALSDARATLKSFIAPRLSIVASSLLSDMTLGKRSTIIVDEDMNITVDGQKLETLSGGAETVVNLALRLALGQVLVGPTFPVFLGDEIDSDADDLRRQAVIDAMVGLKSHLSQIILVTHRDVGVADHIFELE